MLRRKLKADVVVRWYCGTRTRMYAGLVAVGQDVARRRRSEQKKRRGGREQIAGLSGQAGSQSQQDSRKSGEADDLVGFVLPELLLHVAGCGTSK